MGCDSQHCLLPSHAHFAHAKSVCQLNVLLYVESTLKICVHLGTMCALRMCTVSRSLWIDNQTKGNHTHNTCTNNTSMSMLLVILRLLTENQRLQLQLQLDVVDLSLHACMRMCVCVNPLFPLNSFLKAFCLRITNIYHSFWRWQMCCHAILDIFLYNTNNTNQLSYTSMYIRVCEAGERVSECRNREETLCRTKRINSRWNECIRWNIYIQTQNIIIPYLALYLCKHQHICMIYILFCILYSYMWIVSIVGCIACVPPRTTTTLHCAVNDDDDDYECFVLKFKCFTLHA